MKLMTALAVLLLLLAAAAASAYEDIDSSKCEREKRRHSLERCRSFLKSGQSQGSSLMMDAEEDDNEGAPEECCRQLRRTSQDCRCELIRDIMRQLRQEEGFGEGRECRGRCGEMMKRGRFLPAMCNVEPNTCRMRQGGSSY